jgi:CheY-like chemotaxis protein
MKHQVRIAATVREALDAAGQERFDLLLSDIALPDGTGLEVMKRIQAIHPTPGIALSGFGMDEDVQRSLQAGFAEHLTKPVTAERLEQAIARIYATESAVANARP